MPLSFEGLPTHHEWAVSFSASTELDAQYQKVCAGNETLEGVGACFAGFEANNHEGEHAGRVVPDHDGADLRRQLGDSGLRLDRERTDDGGELGAVSGHVGHGSVTARCASTWATTPS